MPKTTDARFRSELRKLRAQQGLTLRELSRKSKVPRSTIHKIEQGHGKANLDVVAKLAKALGVTSEDMICP